VTGAVVDHLAAALAHADQMGITPRRNVRAHSTGNPTIYQQDTPGYRVGGSTNGREADLCERSVSPVWGHG
jgi:hypothetical protein